MDIEKILRVARRNRATPEQTKLILAIIESNGHDAPFFFGVDEDDLVVMILTLIRSKMVEFIDRYVKCDGYMLDDFPGYLASCEVFNLDLNEFRRTLEGITKEAERYGFKRIDRMDKKVAG